MFSFEHSIQYSSFLWPCMVFYSNNNLRLKLFLLKCRRNTRTENLLDTRVFWTTYNHLQIDCFHFDGSLCVCYETSNLIMLKIIICASNVNHLMILKFLRFKNSMEVFLFIVCNVVIWIFGNAQINFVFIFKKKKQTDTCGRMHTTWRWVFYQYEV